MIAVFRLGVHLPLYGINNEMFARLAQSNNIIGFIDLFSGGALANISILALGIGPYITSSIIMQLLTVSCKRKKAKPEEEKYRSILGYLPYLLLYSRQAYLCFICFIRLRRLLYPVSIRSCSLSAQFQY